MAPPVEYKEVVGTGPIGPKAALWRLAQKRGGLCLLASRRGGVQAEQYPVQSGMPRERASATRATTVSSSANTSSKTCRARSLACSDTGPLRFS